MKLYTEEQVKEIIDIAEFNKHLTHDDILKEFSPIELPSDEEIIGIFMNWFLKHYSTATIDGMFGYVNSMEQEVTIRDILDDYFNKEKIINQNK